MSTKTNVGNSGDSAQESLIASLPDGVLTVDLTGRVRFANEIACRTFGVTQYPPPPGEIIGLTVLEATHLRALTELCQRTRQTDTMQESLLRLVGTHPHTISVRCIPLPEIILVLFRDQTELERLRTVRTEFVANVSHELRTPLASIRAMAETLLEGALADPQAAKHFLATIIRESDRLVNLSADLLELSKAESTEPRRVHFDLVELVKEVTTRLHLQAEKRKIRVILNLPEIPVPLFADEHEIDQVVFNLVDNAIKYTPSEGRVTVTVQTHLATTQAIFSVEDTGIGILSQDLPRIFERFWRADRARRFSNNDAMGTAPGGTGLGLSIVKHIVEAHGGQVRAESALGQGSKFTFVLPLDTQAAD